MKKTKAAAALSSFFAALAAAPTPARAQQSEWYGWQTLVSDGATITATAVAAIAAKKGHGPVPAVILVAGYIIPPPIIHAVHSNAAGALGSVGLRLGLPTLGFFVGLSLGESDGSRLGNAVLFGVIGAITAIVIDTAALAYEDVPATSSTTSQQATGLSRRVVVLGSSF